MRRLVIRIAILGLCLASPLGAAAKAADPTALPTGVLRRWIEIDGRARERVRALASWPEGLAPVPVVVLLHGTEGFTEGYAELADEFARAGFLGVAACWFAGSRCPSAPPFKGATLDTAQRVRALIGTVRKLPSARADRIALFGHSRGATLALLVASTGADVRAVVACSAQHAPGYSATRRPVAIDLSPVALASSLRAPVPRHGTACVEPRRCPQKAS